MINADLASGDVCGYLGAERARRRTGVDTVAGLPVTERRLQVNGALPAVP